MADEPTGTAGEELPSDQGAPALDTPEPQSRATDAEPESFIDPKTLPPELKSHWKRMHGAYNKALEKAKASGGGEHAATIQRFWNDPEYAATIIQQRAQQLGFRVTKAEARAMAAEGAEAVADGDDLPKELAWMKPYLDKAVERRLGPLKQRTQAAEVSAITAEFNELAEELAETAPGWEAHEDDMSDVLSFLQSPTLRHRRWGSKLALLHNLATGQAHAHATLARRTADAARGRTTTGQPGRTVASNLSEQIRKAPTNADAWKLAEQAGLEEAKRRGLAG